MTVPAVLNHHTYHRRFVYLLELSRSCLSQQRAKLRPEVQGKMAGSAVSTKGRGDIETGAGGMGTNTEVVELWRVMAEGHQYKVRLAVCFNCLLVLTLTGTDI